MDIQEKELQPKESLAIIQKMITSSRQQFADNGAHMILWGIALIIAGLINYLLIFTDLDNQARTNWSVGVWIGIPVITGILSSIIGRNQAKTQAVQTPMTRLLKYMWIGFGVTLFFTIYIPVSLHISPIPFILLLTGFATFVYGLGVRYKPFIIGSICFIILAFGAFMASTNPDTAAYQFLIFACALAVGYLVPGIMLYKKVKSKNA